jgi:predicted Zn-dependent peptidase
MSDVAPKNPKDFASDALDRAEAAVAMRTLPSGLTIVHVKRTEDARFWLGATVRAGARTETQAEAGVSHFLEHMMFRGSRLHPDFARLAAAFEWLGGDWNAATGMEATDYWYSGVSATAAEVIELFCDFLETPRFGDLETERAIVRREIEGDLNDHGHSTDLGWHASTLLWSGSSMANPILGTPATIGRFTTETLHAYRDRCYVPTGMALIAIGGDESTLDRLARQAGGLRSAHAKRTRLEYAKPPKFEGPAVKWVEHSDNEFEVRLVFALGGGDGSDDGLKAQVAGRVLADGFSSRLVRRLREERGLVYDIDAYATLDHDIGTLDISATCVAESLDSFVEELLVCLADLAANGPTEEESARAVVREVVDLDLMPTDPSRLAGRLSRSVLFGRTPSFVQERRRIEGFSRDDMAKFFAKTVRAVNAALVVLGPADASKSEVKSDGRGAKAKSAKRPSIEARLKAAVVRLLPP